jgi:hypothetical protein
MISEPSLLLISCSVDAVALALAHLDARAVDREAVREQALVRRVAFHRAGDQQRRVEPAAVLVVAFEVQVGFGPRFVDEPLGCVPRSTWKKVEPESNHTSRMSLLLV